jgi:lysophospholipase L1-like esterase
MKRHVIMVIGFVLLAAVITAILAGLFLWTSIGRFANYWNAQNQVPLDKEAYTIVALGDSTAQGVGATSPHKGFVGQIASRVEKDQDQRVQIYNYSKSGAVAGDVVRDQLSTKYLSDADVILVAVGPNDINKGVSKDEYLASYQKILDGLPKSRVVIATIPPLVRLRVSNAVVQDWNKDLAALAEKNGVRVAPVYNAIHPQQYNPLIYAIDLFHPSNIGYGRWADAFYSQLPSDS